MKLEDGQAESGSHASSRMALRTLDTIEVVGATSAPMGLTAIAQAVGVSKAIAYRILSALEERRYVIRDPVSKAYMPGPLLWSAYSNTIARRAIVFATKEILREIAAETGETAHVAVLDDAWVTYLDVVEPVSRVRAWLRPGETVPANAVASGKAILAFAEPAKLEKVVSGQLSKTTEHTIISPAEFRAAVRQSRQRGYGFVRGEWDRDLAALSAPVLGPDGWATLAVGVSGPVSRFDAARIPELAKLMIAQASRISVKFYGQSRGGKRKKIERA